MELKKRTEVISVFRSTVFWDNSDPPAGGSAGAMGTNNQCQIILGNCRLAYRPGPPRRLGPGRESYPLICANCRQFSLLLRVDWRHSRTTKTWPQPEWTTYGPRPQPETSNLPVSCKSNAKPMHSRLESCEWCRGPNPKSFGSNRMPGNCVGPHIRNEYCVGTTQHGRRRG